MLYPRRAAVFAAFLTLASLADAAAAKRHGEVYDVREYGAKGDGTTLDTKALQAAIDDCTKAGGGVVLLHGGDFLSGTVQLKDNVTLRVSQSARLLGSTKREDYLNRDEMTKRGAGPGNGNIVLVFAANAKNVTVEGPGSVNGQGRAFYTGHGDGTAPSGSTSSGAALESPEDPRAPNRDRPHLMVFEKVEGLKIRDVFLTASAYHGVRILRCEHVDIDGVRIHNRVNYNNDGFHFNSCKYVRVSNCEVLCQDDGCALFGSNQFVTVTNCTFSTRWSIFRFGGGAAQNIAISNILIYDTYGSPIKISSGGGTQLENLSFSNIVMRNVTGPISVGFGPRRRRESDPTPAPDATPRPPSFVRNLSFHNIRATLVPEPLLHEELKFERHRIYDGEQNSALTLNAYGDAYIENVTLSDIHITSPGGGTAELAAKKDIPETAAEYFQVWGKQPFGNPAYGMFARNVRGLRMQNVTLDYEKDDVRPALIFDNVSDASVANLNVEGSASQAAALRIRNSKDVYIDAPRLTAPAPVFLQVEGADNRNITVDGGDIAKAGKPLAAVDGAAETAVKVR